MTLRRDEANHMASKHQRPKTKHQPRAAQPFLREGITLGPYSLVRTMKPSKIWITHESGEAMMTEEAKLARVLGRYWKREF